MRFYIFHDLYTSLSVTFVRYFNGRNKDIYYYYHDYDYDYNDDDYYCTAERLKPNRDNLFNITL